MKLFQPVALICSLILTGCTDTDLYYGSTLHRNHRAIIERNTLNYMLAHPETDGSHYGQIREAAFQMVEGMSAKQAIAVFEADGAVCQDRMCIWTDRRQETLADVAFGIRMPGPRRTSAHFRGVTVEADFVSHLNDVSVRHWSRSETTPE